MKDKNTVSKLHQIETEIERLFHFLSLKEVRKNPRLMKKMKLMREKLEILKDSISPKPLTLAGAL